MIYKLILIWSPHLAIIIFFNNMYSRSFPLEVRLHNNTCILLYSYSAVFVLYSPLCGLFKCQVAEQGNERITV